MTTRLRHDQPPFHMPLLNLQPSNASEPVIGRQVVKIRFGPHSRHRFELGAVILSW
jgi:hypothetical protein